MSRAACKHCPFRSGSTYAYDEDAMFALGGSDPACHAIVGAQRIFAESATEANRCVGHDRWVSGVTGFQKPALQPSTDHPGGGNGE